MIEATAYVDWFGTLAGVLGVVLAIYLQLINPRKTDPAHVLALFVAGSALVLMFSTAWLPPNGWTVISLKISGILLFVTLEFVSGYVIWKSAEAAPPREVIAAFFNGNGNGGGT